MIEVKNLSFKYSRKGRLVLDDVSLRLDRGGVYGLLGRNGVGKTTLMYVMAGALTPCKGVVTVGGVDVRRRLPSTLSEVYIVTEECPLPSRTLEEWAREMSVYYPRFSQELLERICGEFELRGDMRLDRLSTGLRKKAALAMGLACRTELLMLDEPTNGLDIPSREAFRRVLAECADEERVILVATHQIHDVERLLSHVIILDEQGVVMSNSLSDVMGRVRFDVSNNPDVIASALWSRPGVGGTEVVLALTDPADETEVELEMLFDYMSTRPKNNPFV